NLYLLYVRRVKRPCLFYADSVGCLSYCKCLSCSAALSFQNSSFKNLDSFPVSFFDFSVNFYGVSDTELGSVFLQLLSLNVFNNVVHLCEPPSYFDVLNTCSYQRTISFFSQRTIFYHSFPSIARVSCIFRASSLYGCQ